MGMNMDMSPADPTIINLPLSDPRCNVSDCLAFAAAGDESQAQVSWASLFKYGHWSTWYYLAIIGLFAASYLLRTYHDRHSAVASPKAQAPTLWQKTVAAGRWLAYRRLSFRGSDQFELGSFGVLALLLATVVFLAALTFAARPYYREHRGYGSPPLAIKTGLMAFACTPILIALAGKANVITLITGISHEKLNIIHRWVGWFTLVLSLVHTIPFFYQPLRDVGYTTLKAEWDSRGGGSMYSGVPALGMLVGLVFLSVPAIRRRVYEAFYFSHVSMAVVYLALLYWHAANLGDSWAYLWATVGLWLASWLARAFWYTRPLNLRNEWFQGSTTLLTQLPGGMTRIEVLSPPDSFSWTAAQHCFLRFPGISLLDNHPFTIVSAPPRSDTDTNALFRKNPSVLFLARTHSGFTQRLEAFSSKNADRELSAWIDGPYGGIARPIERLYDSVVLIAGGSGITACLPWFTSILDAAQTQVRVERISLVWVVKHAEHVAWVRDLLEAAVAKSASAEGSGVDVDVKFFVSRERMVDEKKKKKTALAAATTTAPPGEKEMQDSADEILSSSSPSSTDDERPRGGDLVHASPLGALKHGRPHIASLVAEEMARSTSTSGPKKIFFLGCGPEGLRNELANAVAQAQGSVLRGEALEVGLHLEAFGW